MKKSIIVATLSIALFLFFNINSFSQSKEISSGKSVDNTEIIHLDKESFLKHVWNYEKNPQKWVYAGKKPCIIDFYADWCGPCRLFAVTLQSVANEYDGKIVCYKINIDKEKELAAAFGVSSIPAILFIPKNAQPQMAKGNIPKEQVVNIINDILLPAK